MQVYELMIIFGGDLDEDAIAASLSKVTTNIESEGGRVATVLDSEPWGRRGQPRHHRSHPPPR